VSSQIVKLDWIKKHPIKTLFETIPGNGPGIQEHVGTCSMGWRRRDLSWFGIAKEWGIERMKATEVTKGVSLHSIPGGVIPDTARLARQNTPKAF
jgi:hypothetical protein